MPNIASCRACFAQVATLRALNGVFLGSVGPVSQSILADSAPRKSLGFSFGLVQFCSCMGRLVGGVVTTSVAMVQVGATKVRSVNTIWRSLVPGQKQLFILV